MKILHIDDNSQITNVFSKIFTLKKHQYTSVNNGKDGINEFKNNNFDIVLLDLSMPGFSGFQVLKQLHEDGKNVNNVMVMTAATLSDSEKKELVDYGIRGILAKPVTMEKLMEVIKKNESELHISVPE